MSSRTRDERRAGPQRFAAWLLDVTMANAGGAVYGAATVGVLLAAEDARHEGYAATLEAAAIVLVLYWLASLYAHGLGVRLQRREQLDARHLWRSCVYELPMLEGALVPVLVLLITWAAGAAITTGVTAALWTAAGTVVILEAVAGWRSRREWRDVAFQVGGGVLMGFALLGLKLVLH
jgi:hypothetical protein